MSICFSTMQIFYSPTIATHGISKLHALDSNSKLSSTQKIRRLSIPTVFNKDQLNHDEECAKKSGNLWQCINICLARESGKIITFKVGDKFNPLKNTHRIYKNNVANITKKIYPAIELDPVALVKSLEGLEFFGYNIWSDDDNNVYLDMPDREALITAFERYKSKHHETNWPTNFDIAEAEGTTKDLTFTFIHFLKGS